MMTNNCDDLQLYNMMRMIDGHSLDLDDVSYEGRGEVKIGTHLVINMINSQNQPPHKHLHQSESHWSRILNRSPWVTDKAKQWSDSGKFDNHQHHLYHHHHFCDAGKVEEEGDIPHVGDLVAHLSKKIQNKMITYCWRSWTLNNLIRVKLFGCSPILVAMSKTTTSTWITWLKVLNDGENHFSEKYHWEVMDRSLLLTILW